MKLIYKPFAVVLGLLAGFLGRKLFDRLWGLVDDQEPPKPNTQRATWPKVLGAAALERPRQQRQGVGLQDRAQLVLGEPEEVHQAARAVGAGDRARSASALGLPAPLLVTRETAPLVSHVTRTAGSRRRTRRSPSR